MERAEKAGMQCVAKWRGIPPLNIKKMLLSKKDKRVHTHARSHTCTSMQRRGHTLAHIAERMCVHKMNTQMLPSWSFHFKSA